MRSCPFHTSIRLRMPWPQLNRKIRTHLNNLRLNQMKPLQSQLTVKIQLIKLKNGGADGVKNRPPALRRFRNKLSREKMGSQLRKNLKLSKPINLKMRSRVRFKPRNQNRKKITYRKLQNLWQRNLSHGQGEEVEINQWELLKEVQLRVKLCQNRGRQKSLKLMNK